MPSLTSFPLSVSEILETQKGPFKELEIWALLCQCAEVLQDIIIKGDIISPNVFRYMLSPNNLMIRDNGTVSFAEASENINGTLYSAPECETVISQSLLSDTAFEKMFVFSLGRTLQVASEFGLKQNELLGISYDLDSLLQAMTKRNATLRIGLMHILEACSMEASQNPHQPPHTITLSRLYKTVINSSGKVPSYDSSYGSDNNRRHQSAVRQGRLRRPRQQMRHRRHGRHSSESPPTSRSRSRSRSQSRSEASDNLSKGWNSEGVPEAMPYSNVASSADLNSSFVSTVSEQSDLSALHAARNSKVPPYSASQSVQGLLGLRQGSPAYQKYIQLKERQMRLRQARSGQGSSTLEDVRSRLMTPTLQSQDAMDRTSETRSMASLISFTLGTYMPDLHEQFGSEAALDYNKESGTDIESMFDSQSSLLTVSDLSKNAMRAEKEEPVRDFPKKQLAKSQETPAFQQHAKQEKHHKVRPSQEANPIPEQSIGEKPVPKQREYYGPEFVHKSRKPAVKVVIPFQDSTKGASNVRHVTVVHLTGQKYDVALDPNITARQLMDTVISYSDLDDFFFYGLTYVCEGEHFFLDGDTKLYKVAPEGWKEGPKGHATAVTFTLFVRVKFYPDSLTDFRHTSSYHLLYLQLRRDVIEERTVCDTDTLTKLAGLALQVEYGDFSLDTMGQNYFQAEQYFPARSVRRLGSTYVYTAATQRHKSCTGIANSQAEIEFIKHMRHLPEYGIHFHKLFKSKTQASGIVWVGLSQHHLVLAEMDGQTRIICQDYLWNSIMKISFNKRRFSIQPKVEVAKGKPPKINFYTNSHRKGRYLLQFSTDQHRFQIRMRTRPSNIETLTGDLGVEITPQTHEIGVGDDVIEQDELMVPTTVFVEPSQIALPIDDDEDDLEDEKEDISLASSAHENVPFKYTSPPPYQPPSMLQYLDDPNCMLSDLNEISLDASTHHASKETLDQQLMNNHFLDVSSRSTSLDSALPSDKTGPEEPSHMDSNILFPSSESQVGRRIYKVVLKKDKKQGIGITIVGGETTNSLDLGIFIKSVVPGGPAALDGRIKPGDRLIAIGGTSLEGKQHHEAVALIRDAGPQVELLVSQIKPPGTLRRQNDYFEQAEFDKKLRNSMIERDLDDSSLDENHNIDYNTASDVAAMRFLQFDDNLDNNAESLNDSSSSFHACNSDEENYPLRPPSTPPPPPLPTKQPPHGAGLVPDDYVIETMNSSVNAKLQRNPMNDWPDIGHDIDPVYSSQTYEGLEVPVSPMSHISDELPFTSMLKVKEKFVIPAYDLVDRESPVASFSHVQDEKPFSPVSEDIPETLVTNANERGPLNSLNLARTTSPISSFSQIREEDPIISQSPLSKEIPEPSVRKADEKASANSLNVARRTSPISSFSQVREELPPVSQSPVSKEIPNTSFLQALENVSDDPLTHARRVSPVTSFSNVNEEDSFASDSSLHEELPLTSFGQVAEEIPLNESLNHIIGEVPINSYSGLSEEEQRFTNSSPGHDVFDSGRGSNEDMEDVMRKLRADNELAYEVSRHTNDWDDNAVEDSSGFYQSGLTEEEKGDLQILGDIAALEAEVSSSDSDFDTAIKDTVEGRRKKFTRKAVHPVSPMMAMEAPELSKDLNEVIYEVILERENKNDSFGIVTETLTTNEAPNGVLFIKELILNSPAEQGKILNPGDKMLEINGQRVTGLSASQAHAVLDSPQDFCTVKVSRSASDDIVLSQNIKDGSQKMNDTANVEAISPPPPYLPVEHNSVPLSNLIPSTPKEKTQPLGQHIAIVPPPPPMKLGLEELESNNTQSDVDSDVLDSSRSELESIYKNAEYFLGDDPGETPRTDYHGDIDLAVEEDLNMAIMSQETVEIRPVGKKVDGIADEDLSESQFAESEDFISKTRYTPNNLSVSSDQSSKNSVISTSKTKSDMKKKDQEIKVPQPNEGLNNDNKNDPEKEVTTESYQTESEFEGISTSEVERKGLVDLKKLAADGNEGRLPGGLPQESSASNPDYSQSESEGKSVRENAQMSDRKDKMSYDPELVEVSLMRKDGGGFGFTVAGGINTGGCYIKQLVAAPASQTGTILPGDKILMVNDEDTTKLSHMEAVSMLRRGPDEVTLKLLRYPSSVESQERLMMLKNLAGKNQTQEVDKTIKDQRLPERQQPYGDMSNSSEAPKAVIKPFDNDEERQSAKHRRPREDEYHGKEEVKEDVIIKEIRETKALQSFQPSLPPSRSHQENHQDRRPFIQSSDPYQEQPIESDPMSGIMRIELQKSDDQQSLGIRVTDEERAGEPGVYVKRLKQGGTADRDGRLKAGDRLLQANGVSLVGVDARKAVAVLRDAKDKVVLTVSRPVESDKDLSYEDIKPDYDDDEDIESLVEEALSTLSNTDEKERKDALEIAGNEPHHAIKDTEKSGNPRFSEDTTEAEKTLKCPRDLPVDIPVKITEDWLSQLPLIQRPEVEGDDPYTTDILQSLVDMVESGEPLEEFKNLRHIKEADTCAAGKLPQNKLKNRYRNILPYDYNRVKLEARPSGEDYINASHISVHIGESFVLEYIACQGPLQETTDDFWSMLWQENTGVVINLTQVKEGGKMKCYPYWPQSNEEVLELDGGSRIVRLLGSYSMEEFEVFQLLIEDCRSGECKSITLLQHTSWPDHGAPDTALPLLKLLQVMHVHKRDSSPVIHCSAGIGRTGALVAIDVALATIEREEQFDLYQIVSNLRSQRHGLIQTTDQYLFCYTACMEALLSLEMQDS